MPVLYVFYIYQLSISNHVKLGYLERERERERERDIPVETIVEDVIPDQHVVDGNVAVADEKDGILGYDKTWT